MQAPHRTTVRGSTFVRLLARFTDVDAPQSSPSLPDRLSQWLDWTHALALSSALDGKPPAAAPGMPAFDSAEEAECTRIRASLVDAIAGERGAGVGSARTEGAKAPLDYGVFRQRYLTLQRRMQAATGSLRGRLRDILAGTSVDMARLAEVDAVMELALSPREQTLLAVVPALLGQHFERLRAAGQPHAHADTSENHPATPPGAWLDVFRKDMQSVLLAELDVRFQPVEGLLAALRTR